MKKKINLKEIANNNITYRLLMDKHQQLATITLIKEACKQILKLAAENADIEIKCIKDEDRYFVNKQSILDTINQIE
jgi:uncharacterized membrane-anchored protein YitT (DUF2179 family)